MRIAVVQGTARLLEAARARNIPTTFVGTAERTASLEPSELLDVVTLETLDAASVESILAGIHSKTPLTAVLSLTETGVLPAAQVARTLGVKGIAPESAEILVDKLAMRHRITRNSVHAAKVDRLADLEHFMHAHGGPAILKPRRGTGSTAIFRVDSENDVDSIWSQYSNLTTDGALVEGFARGVEYSVEAFSHDGHHHIVACAEKLTTGNFVEIGHTVPADLDARTASLIADSVSQFLTDVGVTRGPSHTEIRVAHDSAVIIESHNRIGGDKIAVLVRRALGIDLADLTLAEFTSSVSCAEFVPKSNRVAAIRFLQSTPGRVARIQIPSTIPPSALVEVDVTEGDVVRALASSADRVGYVLGDAPERADVLRMVSDLAERTSIETSPVVTVIPS